MAEITRSDADRIVVRLTTEEKAALRSLAAELDELGNEAEERVPEIPDFQLTDVLGRGGMGMVYLAEQLSLGREVALKVVNSSVATSATLQNPIPFTRG